MQKTGTALAKASAFEIDAAEPMFVGTTREALVGSNEKLMGRGSTVTFESCKDFDFVIETVDSGVLVGANGQVMGTTKVSVSEESGRATVWAVVGPWDGAIALIGGMQGWEKRMKRHAAAQKGLEEHFGPNWRELRWAPVSKSVKRPRWG